MRLLVGTLQRADERLDEMQPYLTTVEGMSQDDKAVQVDLAEKLEFLCRLGRFWLERVVEELWP
jgi:hypothetical protein